MFGFLNIPKSNVLSVLTEKGAISLQSLGNVTTQQWLEYNVETDQNRTSVRFLHFPYFDGETDVTWGLVYISLCSCLRRTGNLTPRGG